MERHFNNEDFEKQLRDNANQYRMYPSEKVWKNIHSALHTRRRWYGISAAIMFLLTGTIVSIIFYNGNPGKNNNLNEERVQTNPRDPIASLKDQPKDIFSPAINNQNTKVKKTGGVERPFLANEPLNFITGNDEQPDLTDLQNEVITEEAMLLVPVFNDNILETAETNLVKFNTPVNTEATENYFPSPQDTKAAQNILDPGTENKIKETITALASQTILPIKTKRARVTAQVYFTPTVSYRKLSENKKVYNNGAVYVPVIDLKNVVNHKPAMGLEFGLEAKYRVNDKFSLKAGFQFNINRYDIQAYTHTTEIATVALSSGFGFDSMATLTNYRNFSGGTPPNWLENFYFQAAIPVGVEYIISDNKNLQWGVSGTIQPTYVIGDRAYLISSDYKNYARFPDLMRRWNISSGVGTFVSYSTGKIKWQVGPHVRYQHRSSFVSALTVKEKLFAVGLKVGASLNKQ